MSRRDSAPTHGWIISSQINKWLALAFMVLLLITFVSVWTVTYSLRRDCQDVYKRDLQVGSYWVHIESGSMEKDCPRFDD